MSYIIVARKKHEGYRRQASGNRRGQHLSCQPPLQTSVPQLPEDFELDRFNVHRSTRRVLNGTKIRTPDISATSSDEAHFWLNGYVNKQNCRIWSEANPQVYVETPLHPEKLTVWCALWAGGILLQKR
ncbi:hypothetical protein TNCV_816261 [Trichonephila clavipes]|nr:hypothetical protein TNCV_816261 [Trichonephila clavipes]